MNSNTYNDSKYHQETLTITAKKQRIDARRWRKLERDGRYLFRGSNTGTIWAQQRCFNQLETTPPLRTFELERHTDSRRNCFFLFEPLWETLNYPQNFPSVLLSILTKKKKTRRIERPLVLNSILKLSPWKLSSKKIPTPKLLTPKFWSKTEFK